MILISRRPIHQTKKIVEPSEPSDSVYRVERFAVILIIWTNENLNKLSSPSVTSFVTEETYWVFYITLPKFIAIFGIFSNRDDKSSGMV